MASSGTQSANLPVRIVHAALVADGAGVLECPGAVALRGDCVVAVGSPQAVGAAGGLEPERQVGAAIVPAFVNSHTHLDLTAVGCMPFGGDFDEWLAIVRLKRQGMTQASVDLSVQQGVTALLAGGVAAVGDIAGSHAPESSLQRLNRAGLSGVSFAEVFGMAPARRLETLAAIGQLREAAGEQAEAPPGPHAAHGAGRGLRQGIQPHAPYSAAREVFVAALRSGLPVSTHLAESPEETEFLRSGSGRMRALLERAGAWDASQVFGARHPVDWLAGILAEAPGARILCAHCNEIDDAALDLLAALPVSVAFCPRAGAYFGRTGHRYRDMLARGVTVALGTDSMMSLDTPGRLSTLDDARFLMRNDALPIGTALAMATVHGARALGLSESAFTLAPDDAPKAGILLVSLEANSDDRSEVIRAFGLGKGAPTWLAGQKKFPELLPQVG